MDFCIMHFMRYRHITIIFLCALCMLVLAYTGYIYRPLSGEQRQWMMAWNIRYHLSRRWSENEINISGSWNNYHHRQIWQIKDTSYNIQRTWHIEIFLTWWDIYTRINNRERDQKLWSSLSQTIDTIATTQTDILINILSWKKIQWYNHINNRPRIWIQRSHDEIHIDAYFYCHRRRRTRSIYTCTLDARISSPGWYRPLRAEVESEDRTPGENNNNTIDFSQSISVSELLHRVRK